jgi:2'-5' RNA ligase
MNVIRSFIAVDIPEDILNQVNQAADALKKRLDKSPVRWVPIHNIHLTIKFLGDVSTANIEIVERILQSEASQYQSFEISVGGLGAFPSKHRPRVIWIGIKASADMADFKRNIDLEIARLGYNREKRDFSPHLTLGRVSRNANLNELVNIGEVLSNAKVGFLGATRIKEVHLYKSDLKPNGATYTKLFTANFL